MSEKDSPNRKGAQGETWHWGLQALAGFAVVAAVLSGLIYIFSR
jgi:hypothetical protein